MSTGEQDVDSTSVETAEDEAAKPKQKLDLDVQITDAGPCKKHLKVAIAQADIERQFKDSLGNLRRDAAVPGFRPGRAPKQLVEKRFRKEVAGQVKSSLLMACLEQLDEDYKLNPIAQPNLDVEAIELPETGPMRFEMDVEVQPEFTLPAYKAVTVRRPTRQITDADVEAQIKTYLERYAQLVPKTEGGAEVGDFVTADLTFHLDGLTQNEAKEVQFRLLPELRFQDGSVPKLIETLQGVKPGEVREGEAKIGSASTDPSLRGQTIGVTFHVNDLKRLRLPEVDAEFLGRVGFDSEEELREVMRAALERRNEYQQRQLIRREIVDQLLREASFDLPPDLVARQEQANLRRQVMEMREGGMSDSEIRAREAEVRANAHEKTLQSLKEFFVLSKIAEAESLKVEDEDLEMEIEAIAARTDDTPRRVRARVEKEGLAESLAAQILERKTIDRILEFVRFEEVPFVEERAVETLDQNATAAPAEDAAESTETEPQAEAVAEGGATAG